ncbi:hypothetical protein [Cecembia calidifontis]|jgi:hypothetical protein|uniref:Uncharacterized protein n=1 Tax=Cecembia calidifontis TaxID=1187080 RepID=A0A4Q7PAC6_9BACT|nr:hypothetical protein [Cecembia calidifontis]RZS97174.1 hypothetical protein BC751_2772 [Cecembia calidifontis]
MVKKVYWLTFSLMLSLHVVNAQSVSSLKQNEVDYGRAFRFNAKSDGVKGTPFLYDEPKSAKVSLKGGKVYEDIPFNILPEKEEVYIQTGGVESEPLVLKNWEWLQTLEDEPKLFRMEYIDGKQRIVEILFENDKEKFVALHSKYLVEPTVLKDGYTGPQYDTYKQSTRFYRISGLSSKEFKTNNSGIKEIAGPKYNEAMAFIKSNNIKPDRPSGMKQLLEMIHR